MFDVNGLRGDLVMSACLRYDLAPIPMTFEGKIRITPETAADYQDGKLIKVNEMDFRIVKCEPLRNAGGHVQGKYPLSAVAITAFPEGCVNVARPRRSAVINTSASFSAIYRACGATVSMNGDFVVPRFACFVGDIPTFHLAKVLQEESAVLMWRKGRVQLMRLKEVMEQTPVEGIAIDSAEDIKSSFLEADEIPVYISTDEHGQFLSGARRDVAQNVSYAPHKTLRELNFMSRVLVRRKVITGSITPTLRAGDVLDVRGTPLVIMTAAHYIQSNTDGGGANQYSRLWLGSMT